MSPKAAFQQVNDKKVGKKIRKICPMAYYCSRYSSDGGNQWLPSKPGPHPLVDVLGIVPVHCPGHQNAQQGWSFVPFLNATPL
jgi:hypothetical protein